MTRFALAISFLLLGGCSSTARVGTETPIERPKVAWADVENLDLSEYEDEPAHIDVAVTHEVPASLMENRVDAGLERDVSGYRIQVYSSTELDAAKAVEAETRRWLQRSTYSGQTVAKVYRQFRPPYYRIRVGDFVNRLDAEDALVRFSERFRRAMVVPDVVTIRN